MFVEGIQSESARLLCPELANPLNGVSPARLLRRFAKL